MSTGDPTIQCPFCRGTYYAATGQPLINPLNCGPTHHFACDCREAAFAKLVEALEAFEAEFKTGMPSCLCGTCEDDMQRVYGQCCAALDEFHGRKV